MPVEVVESFTKTPSDGDRTVLAMGAGNLISGFMGGMGGSLADDTTRVHNVVLRVHSRYDIT